MPKFYRRKFKRTYRKKRFVRKRTFGRRKSAIRYDGMIKVKLSAQKELMNNDVAGVSSMLVRWGNHL